MRFSGESRGVLAEFQLVKVFLSNINKYLIDLVLHRIIMDYDGRTTLAKAFAIIELCDHALCQHDATDFVSLQVNSSKSQKVPVVATGLAEAEVDLVLLVLWACGPHQEKLSFEAKVNPNRR